MDALFRLPPADAGRTRSLRFCFVSETYPPEVNGVARTLQRLAAGLAARGHQVAVIRPRQAGDPSTPQAGTTLVRGITLPLYRELQLGLPARRTLRRLWNNRRPDAIYIATEGPLGLAALRKARAQAIPVLSGLHTNFHTYSRHYRLGPLTPLVLKYLRWFHNRTDCTLAPTPEVVAMLRQHGFRRLQTLGRGVDTTLFNPARRETALRREWQLQDGSLGVLYVGRLAAEKNLDLAARAFRVIQARQPQARFVLVGDGPLRHRLASDNADFVFTGMLGGDALARCYASADLLLFPSMSETFGNVVPEAMASGIAVLAYDYAAPRLHVRHGVNGLVVPFGDEPHYLNAAATAVETPERLRALGAAARETALTLDWESIVERFESLIYACTETAEFEHKYG